MSAIRYQTDVWTDEGFAPSVSSGPMSPSALSTSFESEIDRQWSDQIMQLRRIRSMRDDWDGEGAEAPKPEVVDSVEDLLLQIREDQSAPPPSRIVASPDGALVIEWQLGNDGYVEMECSEPYRAEWMIELLDRPPVHQEHSWMPVPVRNRRNGFYLAA